jgi:hypothetical protein
MTKGLERSPWVDLQGARPVQLVQKYFNPEGRFSGRRFEFLGGGGSRPGEAERITAEDLVAVSMLSVNVPGDAAIEILETHAREISGLLKKVPVGKTLWEADEADVDDESSHAAHLWQLLKKIKGVGWVTANKLVARKRPDLLPVYDRIVKAKIQPRSKDLWIPLRNSLLEDDQKMVKRLSLQLNLRATH